MLELIFHKLLPFYAVISLGYLAGRILRVEVKPIATLLVYIISPAVTFGAIAQLKITPAILTLPVATYMCCFICGLLMLRLSRLRWRDNHVNLLALTAIVPNTGFFGVPVLMALAGEHAVGLLFIMNIGIGLALNTLGFYLIARGHYTPQQSLKELAKLPPLIT